MSNPILSYKRIRLRINSDKWDNAQDILAAATPRMYRGNDARFEVCIFWNDEIADLSNLASITLEIFAATRTGAALAAKTIAAADITAIPAAAGWLDGTAQHAAFAFTGAEMNWALAANSTEQNFFLVVSAVTNDSPGRDITFGTTIFTLVEDAAGTAGSPPVNDPLYYTQPDADARFAQVHADGASAQYGQTLKIYSPDTGLWHRVALSMINGVLALVPVQQGEP